MTMPLFSESVLSPHASPVLDAPQPTRHQPMVVQARRSGRRSVRLGTNVLRYRDALMQHGPATDVEMAALLGWGVSSVCGRRGDLNATVPKDRPVVVAVGRVKVGRASQCRWAWVGPR